MKKWLEKILNIFRRIKGDTADQTQHRKQNDPWNQALQHSDLLIDNFYHTEETYDQHEEDADEPDFDIDFEKAAIYDDPFNGAAIQVPIEDFIDLHTFAPDETQQVLDAYIEAAREKGYTQIRIIHGKGIGVQRRIVQSHLKQHYAVKTYRTARGDEGGQGATIAYLKG